LDRSFTGLYGEQTDKGRDEGAGSDRGGSKFIEYFGWQYSTKLIAEYENCTVSEAYELTTIECLNILSYLKAKTDYDNEQIKKVR
jgi:hypothetical protein